MARWATGESVLAHAARVLEAFEHDRRVLTVAEIARKTGLPVPTAHRLVAQLLDLGFLERDEGNRVRIGPHLWEIAALGAQALHLREAAMPYLEQVHVATQQHTQLDVLEGKDVLVVEWLKAREALKSGAPRARPCNGGGRRAAGARRHPAPGGDPRRTAGALQRPDPDGPA
jgi:DNA-binding IclR family transcriptional regulator